MKKLGIRNVTLIIDALKTVGLSEETYYYMEENLYVNEAKTIQDFLRWAIANNIMIGRATIEYKFQEFLIFLKTAK